MPGVRIAVEGMGQVGEQALIIYLYDIGQRAEEMGMEALDALLILQNHLTRAIEGPGIGEVDGHEIALDDSEGSLWVYGQDAKRMLSASLPVICRSPLARGGRATLHYGPVGEEAPEHESFILADLCARLNS